MNKINSHLKMWLAINHLNYTAFMSHTYLRLQYAFRMAQISEEYKKLHNIKFIVDSENFEIFIKNKLGDGK